MAYIHFVSREWWVDISSDIFDDRMCGLRLNGIVDNFSRGKEVEASVNLYDEIKPIVDSLENYSIIFEERELSYVEKLKELLNNNLAQGTVRYREAEYNDKEFLHVDLVISKNSLKEIRGRALSPLPICNIYVNIIDDFSEILRTKKLCTVISASLSLKYAE